MQHYDDETIVHIICFPVINNVDMRGLITNVSRG